MKTQWSAFISLLLLLTLVGCGKEQFGGAPQSESTQADSIKSYEQLSCSSYTLIKPKVDILYVVDNSTSTYYVSSDIKNAIKGTVDKISSQFDYRVVGTPLLPVPGDSTPNYNFQFLTNSTDPVDSAYVGRKIIKSSEFDFFETKVSGGSSEAGLRRTIEFMNFHSGTSSSLFRDGAYHLIIMISNGRDREVESSSPYGNGETIINQSVYDSRLSSFRSLASSLNSVQLRFFAVTPQSACKTGWLDSRKSYVKIAQQLYADSGATDSSSKKDAYDLCGSGISSIFTAVNNSIKQVVLPHTYQYWPITFTNSDNIDVDKIKVYVSSPSSAPEVMDDSKWEYYSNSSRSSINTRISPSAGEPTTARHLIKFTSGNEIVYPKCVTVTSTTKTEYFGYIVLPREPKPETIVIRINGVDIPKSTTNGWSYIGNATKNIKVAYPSSGDELPAVNKSGYMIQLNGSGNYYKSGDSVESYYVGAGI